MEIKVVDVKMEPASDEKKIVNFLQDKPIGTCILVTGRTGQSFGGISTYSMKAGIKIKRKKAGENQYHFWRIG